MCIYNIHTHTACSHLHISTDLCAFKTQSPYLYMWPCTYHEQHITHLGPCPHPVCKIKFHTSLIASRKDSLRLERHSRRYQSLILPLTYSGRRREEKRTCWRYITPQPTPVPRTPPHAGFYDLELNVLYSIPEVEEPSEIMLDVDCDESPWSWNLHTATMMTIMRPAVRAVSATSKPLPRLPCSLVRPEVVGLSPMPASKMVLPLSLQAASTVLKEEIRSLHHTTHVGSEARAQAVVFAKVTRDETRESKLVAHPISLRASSSVPAEALTPRLTTHVGSVARKQAIEFASHRAIPCPVSIHPIALTTTTAYTLSSHSTTHIPSTAREQHMEMALARPIIRPDGAVLPLPLPSGLVGFTARTAAREVLQAAQRVEFNQHRYARVFGTSSGVPIVSIPGSEARLSAVGVAHRPVAKAEKVLVSTPVAKCSLMPVVHAFIIDKTSSRSVPRLRRVSRMTLAFDE